MTDLFDMAQAVEQLTLDQALAAQKVRAAGMPPITPRGHCLNPKCCDEFDLDDPRLFCDATCANEWQRLTNQK